MGDTPLTVLDWQGLILRSRLSPTARHVALTLSWRFDFQTLDCYPSIATLARECGRSPRVVQRALVELRQSGYLWTRFQRGAVGGPKGKTNLYRAQRPPWLKHAPTSKPRDPFEIDWA